jgi:hypothetical protein
LLCAFLEQNKRLALWRLPFNFVTSYAGLITSFLGSTLLHARCMAVGSML